MAPLRETSSWTSRYGNDVKIEPFKRFYLIFEGANTEVDYFEGLEAFRKEVGINNQVDIVILHKDGDISTYSHPKNLLELINEKKNVLMKDGKYDKEIDKFVIIFDRDSFREKEKFKEFISLASEDNILSITSPCFEIWLLLHYFDSYNKLIKPNSDVIFENARVSNHHSYVSKLFSDISGMNPKVKIKFEKLKDKLDIAIEQERYLTQNVYEMDDEIGSNIGKLIELMREDPRKLIL